MSDWYYKNRDRILAEKRKQYATDKAFREKKKARQSALSSGSLKSGDRHSSLVLIGAQNLDFSPLGASWTQWQSKSSTLTRAWGF